jgi:hypothetical protein
MGARDWISRVAITEIVDLEPEQYAALLTHRASEDRLRHRTRFWLRHRLGSSWLGSGQIVH